MHGLLSAAPGWRVEHQDEATLEAVFDFAADAALMAAFPFDHALRIDVTLDERTLRVATTVTAGTTGVPIAFGFHPYLTLPGVPRADWLVEIPVTEQLVLDDQMLPTGDRTPVDIPAGPLGDAHVRRRLPGPTGAVRARRRRPPDRARVRSRLPVRAGVRAAR